MHNLHAINTTPATLRILTERNLANIGDHVTRHLEDPEIRIVLGNNDRQVVEYRSRDAFTGRMRWMLLSDMYWYMGSSERRVMTNRGREWLTNHPNTPVIDRRRTR